MCDCKFEVRLVDLSEDVIRGIFMLLSCQYKMLLTMIVAVQVNAVVETGAGCCEGQL